MNPAITFLIATKNRANTIKDTIQSLLDQEIKEWEAVIVDDHGTDNTAEVVQSFNDERLRYFSLPASHGCGASCARNYGAVMARSPLIAIMDSDDIAYPNRAQVTLEAFSQNPELDLFYGHIDVWEEETGIVRDRKTDFIPFSLERLKEGNFIPHPTVTIKRQVLLDHPYNQFFKIAEDYELYTRLAVAGKKFFGTPEKVLKYRLGASNISTGEAKKQLTNDYGLLAKMQRGWVPFDETVIQRIEDAERA